MRSIATMRPSRPDVGSRDPEVLRSTAWLRFFRFALQRQLRRSFHAVRLAKPGLPPVSDGLPLIVYFNHPSWWDGALVPVVMERLFPARRVFGPIDDEALQRYGFMRRIGFFGVKRDSYAGASTFLRVGRRLLSRADTLFCLTPEGHFTDPRMRPLVLQTGLARLISSVPRVTVLPMAIEYPFWNERLPEALVGFGEPRVLGRNVVTPSNDLHGGLVDALSQAMDRLRDAALDRDATRFTELFAGTVGVGGAYDLGRRLRAWAGGERFDAAHEAAHDAAHGTAHGTAHEAAHGPAHERARGSVSIDER